MRLLKVGSQTNIPLTVFIPYKKLTFRISEFQSDPDAWGKVCVPDVLDGGHLLAVDDHDALPHVKVLFLNLQITFFNKEVFLNLQQMGNCDLEF